MEALPVIEHLDILRNRIPSFRLMGEAPVMHHPMRVKSCNPTLLKGAGCIGDLLHSAQGSLPCLSTNRPAEIDFLMDIAERDTFQQILKPIDLSHIRLNHYRDLLRYSRGLALRLFSDLLHE
jgi:hypothetical protein